MAGVDQEMQLRLAITAQLVDIDEITKDMTKELSGIQRAGQNISRVATMGMVGAAASLGTIASATVLGVRSLIAFEDAFAGVRKTVDADSQTLEMLSGQIRDLATELPIAATELARIGELGGQLGIGVESLAAFIDTVSKLSVATVLSTETAALALARLAAIANIPEEAMSDFFERTGSALVDLGNNFAATEDEIITTVLRIATAAKQTGASTADALAFATALQAIGVPAQAGGTAISRVFQEIERAIQNGDEQLQLFAKVAGVEMKEFAQLFGEDAAMAVAQFIQGLETAGDRGLKVQDILKKLNLSQRRTQLAINGLAASGDLLTQVLQTSRTAFDANIALQVEAAKKFTTTAQQMVLLRNQVKELTMSMADEFLPVVRRVVFFLQAFVTNISGPALINLGRLSLKILAASLGFKALGAAMIKGATITSLLAKSFAILQTVINPTNFVIIAGSIALVTALFSELGREIAALDIGGTMGSLAFGDAIGTAENFGAGTAKAKQALQERRKVLQEEADKFKNNTPNMTESQKNNLEQLEADIEFIDGQIEGLDNSIDFIIKNQIEKLTGSGGSVGAFFTGITADTNLDKSAVDELLNSVLIGGSDPEILIKKFNQEQIQPAIEALEADLTEAGFDEFQFSFGATPTKEQQKIINDINKLKKLSGEVVDLEDAFTEAQKSSAEIAAQKVIQAEGLEILNEGQMLKLVSEIQAERELGKRQMEKRGISEDEIANTEHSLRVKQAELAIQEQMATQARQDAEATLFDLSEREIAIEKVNAIAKKSAESIVSLFEDIPDQVNATASEVTRNLQDQAALGIEFMATITQLQEAGFVALAGMLAKEGPKALAVAQDFLNSPLLAEEAERKIAESNTSFLRELTDMSEELGASDAELRDAFFGTGENLVDGLAEGVRAGDKAIREALIETVNKGIEGLEVTFAISSPSMVTFNRIGVPLIDGIIAGVRSKKDELASTMQDVVSPAVDQAEKLVEKTNIDFSSDKYKSGLATTKTELSEIFGLYTGFAEGLDSVANGTLAVRKAERELETTRKNGLKLTEQLVDANKELSDTLKKFGTEGVQTDFEKLNLMKQQLSLANMISDANKTDTASERLALKSAKRDIEFLEQAVKRGVASEDELQAARETLAEMQGTTEGIDGFQDRDSFENRLKLQKDIMELQIQFQKDLIENMKVMQKEASDEVADAQGKISDIQDNITDQADKEAIAQAAVQSAKFEQFQTQLKLMELADELISLGPEGEKQFRNIALAVGMPETAIDNLVARAETSGQRMHDIFDKIARQLYDIEYIRSQLAINAENTEVSVPPIKPPSSSVTIDDVMYKGGFANIGKRALVGEFGPEIISVGPKGTRVTPTGIGGVGGGVTVNNLNVNVTGVPSDPQSARKAAMSIRKALVNLEKEGSSSSILGR
tara:strand:- start:12079 stop:16329 length:4251 start_codon:yes stop_codon:yes gene_type:complete